MATKATPLLGNFTFICKRTKGSKVAQWLKQNNVPHKVEKKKKTPRWVPV